MNCIVTAGPTYEPLDEVRRLTNFSTGRLGSELATFLADGGHDVTLLLGTSSTYSGRQKARKIIPFTTTEDLGTQLRLLSINPVGALFHVAAVSDFGFGKVWIRLPTGEMQEVNSRKISSRHNNLIAELIPTPKIIGALRRWFPSAWLAGWKYEVDGNHSSVTAEARRQIAETATDACVANGPAYGDGFGFMTQDGSCIHLPDAPALFEALARALENLG
jgi:phosphopantothenoylcysteine synthetase/decarboxylase